jgi:hypothetical protein
MEQCSARLFAIRSDPCRNSALLKSQWKDLGGMIVDYSIVELLVSRRGRRGVFSEGRMWTTSGHKEINKNAIETDGQPGRSRGLWIEESGNT